MKIIREYLDHGLFDSGAWETMSIRWFYALAGACLLWGLGLIMLLPQLFSFLPMETVWPIFQKMWITGILKFLLSFCTILVMVFLVVGLPILGVALLGRIITPSHSSAGTYFLGYNLILAPFIILLGCSLGKTFLLVGIVTAIFSVLGILFPSLFNSRRNVLVVWLVVFEALLLIEGQHSVFGGNFLVHWTIAFIFSFEVGNFYHLAYKERKNPSNAICVAINPFLDVLLFVVFCASNILKALGSGKEME